MPALALNPEGGVGGATVSHPSICKGTGREGVVAWGTWPDSCVRSLGDRERQGRQVGGLLQAGLRAAAKSRRREERPWTKCHHRQDYNSMGLRSYFCDTV